MRLIQALLADHEEEPTFFDYTLRTETPFPLLWKAAHKEKPVKKEKPKEER